MRRELARELQRALFSAGVSRSQGRLHSPLAIAAGPALRGDINILDIPLADDEPLEIQDPTTGAFYFMPGFSVLGGGDALR